MTPRCSLLLAGVGLLAAAATIVFWISTFRWSGRYGRYSGWLPQDLIPLFFGVALVAVSYSAYLLGRGWDRAVAWWSLAAANAEAKARAGEAAPAQPDAGPGQKEFRFSWRPCCLFTVFFILWIVLAREVESYGSYRDIYVAAARGVMWVTGALLLSVATLFLMRSVGQELKTGLTPGMRRFCRVPMFWTVYGVLWLLVMCLIEGWPCWEWETLGGLLMCVAGGVYAAWVAVFLAQVSRWRNAQERFWRVSQADGARAQAPQPAWQHWLVGGVMWLVLIQACLFSCIMFSSVYGRLGVGFSELTSFPLLLVMAHYPTLWMAMLLREMLAVGWFYKSREETE
ncbi:MAG: hypothetical protein NTW87_21105 [Planctomycetota bacterium]|nr:hypothetical protein [Planctomycetota bacterium]